jgi:hypothetical protein
MGIYVFLSAKDEHCKFATSIKLKKSKRDKCKLDTSGADFHWLNANQMEATAKSRTSGQQNIKAQKIQCTWLLKPLLTDRLKRP